LDHKTILLKTKYSAGLIAYSSFGGFKTLTETVSILFSAHNTKKLQQVNIRSVDTFPRNQKLF